ncbi:MAG: YwaF family protein [Clostridia bacterium]|nr:YwaF family protein [Clostridia bacterium]
MIAGEMARRSFLMVWGTFSTNHIISLVATVCIIAALFFILRKRSQKVQTIVLGMLSFSGMGAIIFNLLMWDSPLEYLPLHLCSLNALVLPFAVFTKNKTLNNLLLFWALGALLALVINTAQAHFEIFSWTFVFYYFPHTLELGIPILMFALGLVKKDVRCIISTIVITLVCYTLIHFINVGLNAYCLANNILDTAGSVIQVNYMYSITPANPVLQLFYSIVPMPYWYMLLAVPVIVVYLGGVYFPEIITAIRNKKAQKA